MNVIGECNPVLKYARLDLVCSSSVLQGNLPASNPLLTGN